MTAAAKRREGRDNAGPGREVSAGGIVSKDGKVLLVRVTNLKGEPVWTFPKGHLEPGETAEDAALREVLEETGWACRITGKAMTANYRFMREGRLIQKSVEWFWMAPEARAGEPDAQEVAAVEWAGPEAAAGLLQYPSDRELLGLFKEKA